MKALRRTVAAAELLLIFPATLFMTALFVRHLQPPQNEPARSAQRIVMWYAAKPHLGLWGLLIALPLAVLVIGCGMLLESWSDAAGLRQVAVHTVAVVRAHLAELIIAAATLASGGILATVIVHMLAN